MLSIEDPAVTCSLPFKFVSLDIAYQHSHPVEEAFLESRQAQVFIFSLRVSSRSSSTSRLLSFSITTLPTQPVVLQIGVPSRILVISVLYTHTCICTYSQLFLLQSCFREGYLAFEMLMTFYSE